MPLLVHEWMTYMLLREEMEYQLDTDDEPFVVRANDDEAEVNRFASDWVTLHLFATLYFLSERHQSAFAFLKNGGLKWAEKVRHLTPEVLANASRLGVGGGGIQAIAANKQTPQLLREALSAMQMAFADVLGTDGHRRLCRHAGHAYMQLFGPPLIFCTPNIADTKQLLLLVVEGNEVSLDVEDVAPEVLPKYRDMMQRLARDPVGQTLVFELVMRLFFIHVLGVRPGCLQNRRRAKPKAPREWCTDGIAASSSAPRIFGPVLAFRGEIEAQGRGSLHPHILVWLVAMSSWLVLGTLRRDPDNFKRNVVVWMKECVAAVEATCQSSTQSTLRRFNNPGGRTTPLPFTQVERRNTLFDGGSELDAMRAEHAKGAEVTREQQEFLESEEDAQWLRPSLPVRDASGEEVPANATEAPRVSVYGKRLCEFAVSRLPKYRRLGSLSIRPLPSECRDEEVDGQTADVSAALGPDADEWERAFADDVRSLGKEVLLHICGESCYKYSGSKVEQICRHGFFLSSPLGPSKQEKRTHPGIGGVGARAKHCATPSSL